MTQMSTGQEGGRCHGGHGTSVISAPRNMITEVNYRARLLVSFRSAGTAAVKRRAPNASCSQRRRSLPAWSIPAGSPWGTRRRASGKVASHHDAACSPASSPSKAIREVPCLSDWIHGPRRAPHVDPAGPPRPQLPRGYSPAFMSRTYSHGLWPRFAASWITSSKISLWYLFRILVSRCT